MRSEQDQALIDALYRTLQREQAQVQRLKGEAAALRRLIGGVVRTARRRMKQADGLMFHIETFIEG